MKSIGKVVKESRLRKKLSKEKLEGLTKIKKSFIEAIEKEKWQELPDYPVVVGFVKSIALALKISPKHLLALLRRDYPPKALSINPKPDVEEKFSWSPKMTFFAATTAVTLLTLGYLIYQYLSFIRPPKLFLEKPLEAESVHEEVLEVSGKTDPDAAVSINNQPTLVDEDGNFSAEIEIFEGTQEIVVVAKSRSGKETVVKRRINVELAR